MLENKNAILFRKQRIQKEIMAQFWKIVQAKIVVEENGANLRSRSKE